MIFDADVNFILEATTMTTSQVDAELSNGDFVTMTETKPVERPPSKSHQIAETEESEEILPILFSCPVDGCVKLYQRFSSVERHVLYGRCTLVEERNNLLDKAKVLYRKNFCKARLPSHLCQAVQLRVLRC